MAVRATVSDFGAGKYLVWKVRGHLTIQVSGQVGPNAVLSGVLVGKAVAASGSTAATFVKIDATTQGSWRGVYGEDGYVIVGDQSSDWLTGAGGAGSLAISAPTGCPWRRRF